MRASTVFRQLRPLYSPAAILDYDGGNNIRTFGELLRLCTVNRLFLQGKQLHCRLILLSVTPDNYLATQLIRFYSQHCRLHEARRVFDGIPRKNLFSFNAMLLAYSAHDKPLHLLHLFQSLPLDLKPDAFSISSLLKVLSSSVSPALFVARSRLAREIHGYALAHALIEDIFVGNGLITLYSRCHRLGCARKTFDQMPVKDIVSWNSMISGYSQSGFYEECIQLYRQIETKGCGIKPDNVTVASVLQACSNLKDLEFGMEVHHSLAENKVVIDIAVQNSIIGFYAKCGKLEYARRTFDDMTMKDDVTFGAMIAGYMAHGLVDPAMELFSSMGKPSLSTWNAMISGLAQNNCHNVMLQSFRQMQTSGQRPNSVTLSSILPAISFSSNLLTGKQIHGYAIRNDLDQDIYIVASLIDVYAKLGCLHQAHKVFNLSIARSVIVWTSIISAYSAHGIAHTVLRLFFEMVSLGIEPDSVTVTAVLAACAHAGLVDEAQSVFERLTSVHGIKPTAENYACMVGVLSRAGKLNEALAFISSMPIDANAKAWGALLNGASVFGDVMIGRLAFNQLLRIEPDCTGNYIIMANIYSKAGRYEEAKKVREDMRRVGLEKLPGCSWIEMGNELQVFLSKETTNIYLDEIYEVLDYLSGAIREEGYSFGDELGGDSFAL